DPSRYWPPVDIVLTPGVMFTSQFDSRHARVHVCVHSINQPEGAPWGVMFRLARVVKRLYPAKLSEEIREPGLNCWTVRSNVNAANFRVNFGRGGAQDIEFCTLDVHVDEIHDS